jgi:nucleoside-diphosphate-sugar epimerase
MATRIAILGGAGHIAWHLATHLRSYRDYEVVAICRSPLLASVLTANDINCSVYDSGSPDSLRRALEGAVVIVDTTFSPSVQTRSDRQAGQFYDTVASLPDVRQLIHLSSIAVYGELSARPKINFDRPKPDTMYGQQKLYVERLAGAACRRAGVRILVLRLGHVYGPHMGWSSIWLKLALTGLPAPKFLTKASNAIHVAQLCHSVEQSIRCNAAGLCNALADPNLSWAEVLEWHARALQVADPQSLDSSRQSPAPVPSRYTGGAGDVFAQACRSLKSSVVRSVLGAPLTAQSIRRLLAAMPFLPSVPALKAAVGAPAIHEYSAANTSDESLYVLDSVEIPGPMIPSDRMLAGADFNEFVSYVRSVRSPDLAKAYIENRLASDQSSWVSLAHGL